MISPVAAAALKKELNPDEKLYWVSKSKGVIFHRMGILFLIIAVGVFAIYFNWASEMSWEAALVFGFIFFVGSVASLAPVFSYHIITSDRVMEKTLTRIPIEISTQTSTSTQAKLRRVKWLGRNCFVLTEKTYSRTPLLFGKFRLYTSIGFSFSILHGVQNPDAFEQTYYAAKPKEIDIKAIIKPPSLPSSSPSKEDITP